ncbi:hypothetical protein FRX31_020072, partial [Thalictrum thalictroides]
MASSIQISNELISASESGDVDYVKRFELDALRNWRSDEFGSSALVIAAAVDTTSSVCAEILERCPSLLCKPNKNGITALHAAAVNDNPEVIKFLLSASVASGQCYKLLIMKKA